MILPLGEAVSHCSNNDVVYLDDSDKNCSYDAAEAGNPGDNSVKYAFTYLLCELGQRGFVCASVRGFSPTHLFVKESTFLFHMKNLDIKQAIRPYMAMI